MLAVALKVATLYAVAIVAFALGVALSADIRRWLQGRKQAPQGAAERFGLH